MTQKQHNIVKWIILSTLIIAAIAIMYHVNKPIEVIEKPKNDFPDWNKIR
jgi:hypothetical protein